VAVGGGWVGGRVVQTKAFFPLFLFVKDVNGVLELRQSCCFFVVVLPSGFGTVSCYLPSIDCLLFLIEPFDLLLDSG
jgi:hypothetical protein